MRGCGSVRPVTLAVRVGCSRRGLGTRCWPIRLPKATRAFPICSLVLWIVAMRGLLDSGVDLATEMRAPENSVASRRPWPSRPMIWPAASSGIDKVHRDRVEDCATSSGAVAVLGCIDRATTAFDDFAVTIGFEPCVIVGRGGDSDRPATANRDRRPSSSRRCAPSRRLVRATPSALGMGLDPSSIRSSVARTVASRGSVDPVSTGTGPDSAAFDVFGSPIAIVVAVV